MLIGLVRDSVMQCFCHTCRAPVFPAAAKRSLPIKKPVKTRTKQPKGSKKVKFITTEIRCQEKAKGGLSYEVILAEPAITAPQSAKNNTIQANKNLSVEEIQRKLKEAEQRRLSLEAKKVADWSNKMTKIEEASRKKDELNNEFINQTKEALDAKMEQSIEKREAMIMDIKEKLRGHSLEIEKTRSYLEHQKNVERLAIEDKLKTAAQIRNENIKKMLDRLKEHNTIKITERKVAVDARENEKKMEQRHVFENKLYLAELNREKEFQKKLENLKKHDDRIKIVRQNKAALGNMDSVADDNMVQG